MKYLYNFLNMTIIGKELLQGALMKKLASKIVGLTILTTISIIMMCMLMMFTLYISYNLMLQNGISANVALLLISLAVFLLMAIFTTLAVISLRKLQNLLKLNTNQKSEISKVVEAFKDGLLNRKE